jgi:SAM-dependent methyltransferase
MYSALIRYFGLGLSVPESELISEGVHPDLLRRLMGLHPAISRSGNFFIPHHHWPARPECPEEYIYFGRESLQLIQCIQPHLENFVGKKVLDVGCGSGALAFEVASLASQVLGIDNARQAILWAQAAARAQDVLNVAFAEAKVGSPLAEIVMEGYGHSFDIGIFNPPMTIPRIGSKNPYRDGGNLGVEIPFAFLDFVFRHLRPQGQVFCLITNPIIHGRSVFFDRFENQKWRIQEMSCLNHHFNQSLYREDRYRQLGIDRIELWFLFLNNHRGERISGYR